MLRSRFLLLSATACCAAVAVPAAAQAHTVSSDGTTVTITGTDAPESITISVDEPGFVRVDATSPTPGCDYNEPLGYTSCPLGSGGVVATMGGGGDSVFDLHQSTGGLPDKALKVDLGAGDDTFTGGEGGETVSGGPGNDELKGAGGDDVLDGGDGDDKLTGEGGRDQLLGGAGNDLLDGDVYSGVNADLIDGGPGMDRAEGWADPSTTAEHPPISVTLDGVANDGRPGEGDDVRSIERLTSNVSGTVVLGDEADVVEMWSNIDEGRSTVRVNGGNDVVTGGSREETIDGGAGDDRLEGGFGNDTITGGPGRDTVNGDFGGSQCGVLQSCTVPFGNDVIDVRDGEADQVVCGPGTDTVTADVIDTIGPDCETVDRAGAGSGAGGSRADAGGKAGAGGGARTARLTLSLSRVSRRAALKSGIPVTVVAPVAGTLSGVALKSGATVAKGSAGAKAGKKVTLRLKATRAGKKRLRGKVTVRVTFRPKGGKAVTTTKALTLR